MSRWYRFGEDRTIVRLPYYMDLEENPEMRCEMKTAASGEGVVMIRLKIVTDSTDYDKQR